MRKRMEALIQEMLAGKILLAEAVGEFEKIYIQKALEQNGDHLMKTAEALGIHRNTLSARLTSYKAVEPTIAITKQRKRASSKKKSPPKKLKARAAGNRG